MSPTLNLRPEENGSVEFKQLTEDAATSEMHLELEDKPSISSAMVEAQIDAIPERSAGPNDCSEAEGAGKTMNDENVVRKSRFEETPASETSADLALINVPTEGVETGHADEKNDAGETEEQPSMNPTEELVQNEYHIKTDGGLAKDLLHFRSIGEALGKFEMDVVKETASLPFKEVDKPNEQSQAVALVINMHLF